jgi:DNA-binding response OmpR family regulator
MHPAPLVVLLGDPENLARSAAQIRHIAPAVAIVALGPAPRPDDTDTDWRIRVMAAGADACHAVSIDVHELVAVLLSWGRHVAPTIHTHAMDPAVVPPGARGTTGGIAGGAASAGASVGHPWRARSSPAWRLSTNGRELACPQGRTLPLTGSESGFLTRMAASEGQLLRRTECHGETARANGLPGSGQDARSVDVLVSRLRRKARHAGIDLPLLAVRGCGYLFAECLDMAGGPAFPCQQSAS